MCLCYFDDESVTCGFKDAAFNVDVDFCGFDGFVSKEVFNIVYVFGLVVEMCGFPVSEGVESYF